MFSLIIVLISIVLVAALALATLYYGGGVFTQGQQSARAAGVVNTGQQVLGAMELFKVENGRYPGQPGVDGVAELISAGYLKAEPATDIAALNVVPQALAAGAIWTIPEAGVPTATLTAPVSLELCREINRKARGDNGVLLKAYPAYATQCFGADTSNLTVVVTKSGEGLAQVVGADNVAGTPTPSTGSTPADGDGTWLAAPGESSGGSGGGSGGSPDPDSGSPIVLSRTSLPFTSTNTFGRVTVTNTSSNTVAITASLTGSSVFSLYDNGWDCSSLASGASCAFDIQYTPNPGYSGVQTGQLLVNGRSVALSMDPAGVNRFIVVEADDQSVGAYAWHECPSARVITPSSAPMVLFEQTNYAQYTIAGDTFPGQTSTTGTAESYCIPSDPADTTEFYINAKQYSVGAYNRLSPAAGGFGRGGYLASAIAETNAGENRVNNGYSPYVGPASMQDSLSSGSTGSVQFTAKGVTYTVSAYRMRFEHANRLMDGAYDFGPQMPVSTEMSVQLVAGKPAIINLPAGAVSLSN